MMCLSVRPSLKISVTTGQIRNYSSGYIPISPVVGLSYFLGGWDSPKNKKNPPSIFSVYGAVGAIKLLVAFFKFF